ncbi:hypothetical protein [Actinophytocola sp.]|uniref:hypothetical protein n=1 Tax=Actinophytocola sp. TaxID=1872138 RepID=UPI002ED92FD1
MIRYCRAYPAARLGPFPGAAAAVAPGNGLVYLWDDFSVTAEPFAGAAVLFPGDDADWRAFCVDGLGFDPAAARVGAGAGRVGNSP